VKARAFSSSGAAALVTLIRTVAGLIVRSSSLDDVGEHRLDRREVLDDRPRRERTAQPDLLAPLDGSRLRCQSA
jgi:hypothetical protein